MARRRARIVPMALGVNGLLAFTATTWHRRNNRLVDYMRAGGVKARLASARGNGACRLAAVRRIKSVAQCVKLKSSSSGVVLHICICEEAVGALYEMSASSRGEKSKLMKRVYWLLFVAAAGECDAERRRREPCPCGEKWR